MYSKAKGKCFTHKWIVYLFLGHDKKDKCNETLHCEPRVFQPLTPAELDAFMTEAGINDKQLVEDWNDYPSRTLVRRYADQSGKAISHVALLVGFLSIWLRYFEIPGNYAVDRIYPWTLFVVVRLVFGRPTDLLSAMTFQLCAGLHEFSTVLLGSPERNEFPRTEISFTYPLGWLVYLRFSPNNQTLSMFLYD